MQPIQVKPYLSPTLVLLALDWEEAPTRPDFLGFAIKRTPGFRSADGTSVAPSSWLPNRIGFDGAVPENQPDLPSNVAPVQKFQWWDNRIDTPDVGGHFTYEVWAVCGDPAHLQLQEASQTAIDITLPDHTNSNGIGSWFNRAVVRSQAFRRYCDSLGIDQNTAPTPEQDRKLRSWLANGMENVVPDFLDKAGGAVGAIYHLTDSMFIIPAFQRNANKPLWMTYDAGTSVTAEIKKQQQKGKQADNPNQGAIDTLGTSIMRTARTHTNIMHNKFLVAGMKDGNGLGPPTVVTMGSANYTTEGLSEQANLIHVIESGELAEQYLTRANLLLDDPSHATTQRKHTGWSDPVAVGKASIRINFSPEPDDKSTQLDAIVEAIKNAQHSVLFCLFSPTDKNLRDACFAAGDRGLMMFGLTNHIGQPSPDDESADPSTLHSDKLAAVELYHRSRDKKDVIDARYFDPKNAPAGFEPEFNLYPGSHPPPYPPVIIHHKFIVIDAESNHPVIYTGSPNMSNNSEHKNDENLLEITGDTELAAVYLAEFMRLYEHYRARAYAIAVATGDKPAEDFKLKSNFNDWGSKYFEANSPEAKARKTMVE
jgi:phosphatidylserine/phosphatidylglycerophosphate/cardiolipin synthase-like enzyme